MSKDLTVVEQREVTFYDDQLTAVRADDGQVYVSVRRMCDALGLDRKSQQNRIRRHTILVEGYKGGVIMTPPSSGGRGGGRQQATFLRVDLVPLWLSGVDASRVKDEARPKIERFQREAAKVLWQAFQEGRLTATPSFDELLEKDTPAVNAYKTALAIVELARNQILIEARLDDYGERLERIESVLGDPGRYLTPDQATAISQAVKAVARELGKQTKRNEYGGVYGELYRRYRIPSYKELPASDYSDCIKWLGDWLESLVSDAAF